jgi:hypothetical protein
MIKDELKKEEEKWLCNNLHSASEEDFIKAMVEFAEPREKRIAELEQENAELRKVAEFQQSSNMSRYFENKKLKEGLAVGSTLNKGLNSLNKALEEERDKYRNMVFDKDEQLTKAKELIEDMYYKIPASHSDYYKDVMERARQFLKENE